MRDYRSSGLPPAEVAILAFVEKVTLRAHEISRQDIDELRRQGLSDAEVLDIAMAAGARSLFSKVLDAVGAEPEQRYRDLEEGLIEALAVGRNYGENPGEERPKP
jgi:alkylhydroperoxidase family enzyme